MTTEIYGVLPEKCSNCNIELKPGIGYGFTDRRDWENRRSFGSYICLVPDKCMKCEKCGESRSMTDFEAEYYKDRYKRITK